ncbi:hypothetical protein ACJX0J_026581, partial [Zea mays]
MYFLYNSDEIIDSNEIWKALDRAITIWILISMYPRYFKGLEDQHEMEFALGNFSTSNDWMNIWQTSQNCLSLVSSFDIFISTLSFYDQKCAGAASHLFTKFTTR